MDDAILLRLVDALRPLVDIADAYDANELDDEARKRWGRSLEHENTRSPDEIELYQGRGGKRLLTLADAMRARDALASLPRPHADDLAVDRFAAAMKAKMARSRAKGRGGWDDPHDCPDRFLIDLFHGHLRKGNPGNHEDLACLLMMLWHRGIDPARTSLGDGDGASCG